MGPIWLRGPTSRPARPGVKVNVNQLRRRQGRSSTSPSPSTSTLTSTTTTKVIGKKSGSAAGAGGGRTRTRALRCRKGKPAGRPLFLARGHPVQALLVLEDEQAALIREEPIALHLVDQRRHERAGRADEIGQVLLGDAVQAKLVSGSDPLTVRLGEREEHFGEAGGDVLAGQAEDALPHLANAIVEGADDVDGERRPGLEQRAEIAALDAPHLALPGADGELFHQRAFRP